MKKITMEVPKFEVSFILEDKSNYLKEVIINSLCSMDVLCRERIIILKDKIHVEDQYINLDLNEVIRQENCMYNIFDLLKVINEHIEGHEMDYNFDLSELKSKIKEMINFI